MVYTSIENEKIKEIKKLNQKKYRDKSALFLVEGEHLVLEAYKSGYLKELLLNKKNGKGNYKTLIIDNIKKRRSDLWK